MSSRVFYNIESTRVERQNIGGASEQECVCVVTSTLFIQGERWCGYIGGTRVREFYVTSTLPRCHVNTIEVERLNRSVGVFCYINIIQVERRSFFVCLLLHQHNPGGALERLNIGGTSEQERLNIGGTSEHE